MTRLPAVPLITCDPDFSVWSPADKLYEADTVHWTGKPKRINGRLIVDGKPYRFMGFESHPTLEQTALEIGALSSRYRFEGAGVSLRLEFMTPVFMDSLELCSAPASYIFYGIESSDGKRHDVTLEISFTDDHIKDSAETQPLASGVHTLKGCAAAWFGKRKQTPLGYSGDHVSNDWGYLYAAVPSGEGEAIVSSTGKYLETELTARREVKGLSGNVSGCVVAAYDDIAAINYFGETRRGYWARNGATILDVIEQRVARREELHRRAELFEKEFDARAAASGGEALKLILRAAYRQSFGGHKLIADEHGDAVFVSKECHSNGCAATVDITYPSAPLFLLYNPELVKGMLRPVLRFSQLPVWTFDFAPHDVGRYPHVTGQVYGLKQARMTDYETYPNFYAYPAGSDIYDLRYQMPVEECGNMLIMMAAVAKAEGNADFSKPYLDLLETWARYLKQYGGNPGEQLCTDDFAGHLAHNCNLAAKAIMGIEALSLIFKAAGDDSKAVEYHTLAKGMAADWVKNTKLAGDHTRLVFDRDDGWSLKYNLVWDKLFGSRLFPDDLYESELRWYIKETNEYGVPLDSRRDYTESDWILWTTAFTRDPEAREKLVAPVAKFLAGSPDRVPFSDWYDTKTGAHFFFQNRTVQGGLFMPLLADMWNA